MVKHTFTWLKVWLAAFPLVGIFLSYFFTDSATTFIKRPDTLFAILFVTFVGMVAGWILNLFTNFRGAPVLYSLGQFLATFGFVAFMLSERKKDIERSLADTRRESEKLQEVRDASGPTSADAFNEQIRIMQKLETLTSDTLYESNFYTSNALDSGYLAGGIKRHTIVYTLPPDDQNWVSEFADTDTGLRVLRHREMISNEEVQAIMIESAKPLLNTVPGYH